MKYLPIRVSTKLGRRHQPANPKESVFKFAHPSLNVRKVKSAISKVLVSVQNGFVFGERCLGNEKSIS